MRTSNKLILAYFILIVTSVTILYATSLNHDVNIDKDITDKKVNLQNFTTIVVENGADLHVEKSDSNILTIEIKKDMKIPERMYKIQNDTLYVYGGLRTFVKAKNVSTIDGRKHYWLGIKGYDKDNLKIRLSGGKTQLENDGLKSVAAMNLDLQLKDSATLEAMYIGFDTLKLSSVASKMEVYQSSIKVLKAELKHNSSLVIPSPDKMQYIHESGCKLITQ